MAQPNINYGKNILYGSYLKIERYKGWHTGRAITFIQEFSAADATEFLYAKGIAICGPNDKFSRKKGKELALNRAEKIIERFSNCNFDVEKYDVLYELDTDEEVDSEEKVDSEGKVPKRQKTMLLLFGKDLDSLERRLFEAQRKEDSEVAKAILDAKIEEQKDKDDENLLYENGKEDLEAKSEPAPQAPAPEYAPAPTPVQAQVAPTPAPVYAPAPITEPIPTPGPAYEVAPETVPPVPITEPIPPAPQPEPTPTSPAPALTPAPEPAYEPAQATLPPIVPSSVKMPDLATFFAQGDLLAKAAELENRLEKVEGDLGKRVEKVEGDLSEAKQPKYRRRKPIRDVGIGPVETIVPGPGDDSDDDPSRYFQGDHGA